MPEKTKLDLDPDKNFTSAFIQIEEGVKYECQINDCAVETQNKTVVRFALVVKSPDARIGFHYPYIEKLDEVDSQWYRFNCALFGKDTVMSQLIERKDYMGFSFFCTFKKLELRGGKCVYPIFEVEDRDGEMVKLIG